MMKKQYISINEAKENELEEIRTQVLKVIILLLQ